MSEFPAVRIENAVIRCCLCARRPGNVVVEPDRWHTYRYCARCVDAALERAEIDKAADERQRIPPAPRPECKHG